MDKILVSVLRSSFIAVCEEMGLALLRTARSAWLNVARDFSTSLFDGEGRLLAQADFIPILVGTSRYALRAVMARFGADIHPGDVILLNDPYHGGSHLPDLTLVYPIFLEGRLAYWVVNKAHYGDVGGCVAGGYNPHAVEVYQEGLRIPPLKLYRRGVLNEDLKDFLLLNVRESDTFWADLQSHVACARTGERKLNALARKYGLARLAESHECIFDSGEAEMRAELAGIPPGAYRGRAVLEMEQDGQPLDLNIEVLITVDSHVIRFDYAGTHPQVASFVNSSMANTYSATCVALFSTLDADIQRNEGSCRPIEVTAPEGCLVNPTGVAPVGMSTLTTGEVLIEACWRALSHAMGSRTPAGWARTATPITFGNAPRNGRWYSMAHFVTQGGAGAVRQHDGWSYLAPSVSMGALTKPNVETMEAEFPYRVLTHEFAQDSCGAGRCRGGMGTVYRMTPIGHTAQGVLRADGFRTQPFGLEGGKPAPTTRVHIFRKDGKEEVVKGKSTFVLHEGDVFESRTSGGGGWGDPSLRDRSLVLRDIGDGLVSPEYAAREYHVSEPVATR